MKMTHIAEAVAMFAAIVFLSHLGVAYDLFRVGMLWIFGLGIVAAIAYGLILIALSLSRQSQGEGAEVNVIVAALSSTSAIVGFVLIIIGGLTGVLTAWN